MKLSKKERLTLAVGLMFAVVAVMFLYLKADAAVTWTTDVPGSGLTLKLYGRTELVGANGQPIQLRFLAKMAMLPLSFVYQGQEVGGLRVTVSYTVEGENVDWDTVVVSLSALGTGGYAKTQVLTGKSNSFTFTLPITTDQLGRLPETNETITWILKITARAEARNFDGEPLSAELQHPITSTVSTTWHKGGFEPESTPAASSPDGTFVGGGCGPPDHHLVWVSGVEGVPLWLEFGWQIATVFAAFSFLGSAVAVLVRH